MARTVKVIVTLTPGTPRLHLWCDRCMTSARFEVDVYTLTDEGPHRLATINRCTRCDRES